MQAVATCNIKQAMLHWLPQTSHLHHFSWLPCKAVGKTRLTLREAIWMPEAFKFDRNCIVKLGHAPAWIRHAMSCAWHALSRYLKPRPSVALGHWLAYVGAQMYKPMLPLSLLGLYLVQSWKALWRQMLPLNRPPQEICSVHLAPALSNTGNC